MSLDPWTRCEEYVECQRALAPNGHRVLFECGHERYWYLSDRVLPQVEHEYPSTTVPIPPYSIVRLVDLLTNEEIAWARDGYIIVGVERDYSEFIRLHLQGCLVGRMVLLFPSEVKSSSCKFLFHISAQ